MGIVWLCNPITVWGLACYRVCDYGGGDRAPVGGL